MLIGENEVPDRLYHLLMYYALKGNNSLSSDVEELWKLNYLTKGETSFIFNTAHSDELSIAKSVKSTSKLPLELAEKMRELFPKGKKDGTNYQWRDSKIIIAQRLVAWKKMFCIDATDEEIIDATRRYVASFNGNYSLMRLLKYFIMKKEVDSYSSELASLLENGTEQDDGGVDDWTVQLWR